MDGLKKSGLLTGESLEMFASDAILACDWFPIMFCRFAAAGSTLWITSSLFATNAIFGKARGQLTTVLPIPSVVPPSPTLAATKVMVDMLELKPADILLEIGTGTGLQTAIWQRYCKEVHSVELKEEYKVAENQPLGPHVYLSYGDGAKGLPDVAPFDAIVATCGVKDIPGPWIDQLADGGRLVVPIGTPECQKLTLFRKLGGHLIPVRVGAYTRFVMLEKE